ncbi:MAG: TetR/AcrR family transcriptional regulator [Streptosporangiaceae bacterium]
MADQASHGSGGATTRRRRADAGRSIESILDAALNGILTEGELNMSAVARDAGLSRVTLYAHFPTREALLEAVLRRAVSLAALVIDDADIEARHGAAGALPPAPLLVDGAQPPSQPARRRVLGDDPLSAPRPA